VLCLFIAKTLSWSARDGIVQPNPSSGRTIDGIVISPTFLHGGVFQVKTDEALVRKSVDALLSCAKNIRALELGRPILIVVDFPVDEESLVRFEQLRTIVWLTRSFRDVAGLMQRLKRACPIGAETSLRLSPYRKREISASAQSTITRFILLREAIQQIGWHRVIAVEADVLLLSPLQEIINEYELQSTTWAVALSGGISPHFSLMTVEYLEHLNARTVEIAETVEEQGGCINGFGQDMRLHYEAIMRMRELGFDAKALNLAGVRPCNLVEQPWSFPAYCAAAGDELGPCELEHAILESHSQIDVNKTKKNALSIWTCERADNVSERASMLDDNIRGTGTHYLVGTLDANLMQENWQIRSGDERCSSVESSAPIHALITNKTGVFIETTTPSTSRLIKLLSIHFQGECKSLLTRYARDIEHLRGREQVI